MAYPCRFEKMSEDLPPHSVQAKELRGIESNMRKAGVPTKFWRYDLKTDQRLDGIRAYNRGVDAWNRLSAADQERHDRFATR